MSAASGYGLSIMLRALASSAPTPVATAHRSPMISVGIDDREVHVVLLAILAWHCRRDGKEHGVATLYNGDQSNEIPIETHE